ncbi:MAG: hypothetical protein K6A64_03715 [Bacteroidales bacterium]|nr:hypothetical protein [Bacteroidales bacterium]
MAADALGGVHQGSTGLRIHPQGLVAAIGKDLKADDADKVIDLDVDGIISYLGV